MTLRDKINAAADKAGLNSGRDVNRNAFLLLAYSMVECGSLSLPYGSLAILSEVLRERTGHATPTGSLRWYRVQMMKDTKMVAKIVTLPEGLQTLVSAGQ